MRRFGLIEPTDRLLLSHSGVNVIAVERRDCVRIYGFRRELISCGAMHGCEVQPPRRPQMTALDSCPGPLATLDAAAMTN